MSLLEERIQQIVQCEIVRDDEVGAHSRQPVALPSIDAEAFRLICRHSDCGAADLLYFLNLDVPVAESEELVSAELGRFVDALVQQSL
jgi:hypothetical protein